MMWVSLVTIILAAMIHGNSALQVSVVTSPAGPTYKAGSLYSVICQASNGIPPYSYAWSVGCSYSNTMSSYIPYINIIGPYATTRIPCRNRFRCRVIDSIGGSAFNETIIETVTDIEIHLQIGSKSFFPSNISILTANESGRFFDMVCTSGLKQPNLGKWIHPNGTEITASNNKYTIEKGGGIVSLPYNSLTLKQGYSLTAPYDYGLYRCRMLDIEMIERESHIWILKEQSFNSAIPEYFRSHSGTDLVTLYCGYSNTPGEITWSIGGVTLNNNEVYQTSQRLLQTDPVLYEGAVDIKNLVKSLIKCTTRTVIIGNVPNQSPLYEAITSDHYFFLQFVGQPQPITCSFSRNVSTIAVSSNGVVLLSAVNTAAISFQTSVGDATHNRVYSCIATLDDTTSVTLNFTIVALIPSHALTMHVVQPGTTEAGKPLILDLSAIKITGFTYEQSLSCTNDNGISISQLDGFDYPQNPTLSGLTLHHRVTINNVKLSHAGLYFCKATLETLQQLDNITDHANFTITVKIPAPVIMLTNQTTTRTGGVGQFDCNVSLDSSYNDVPLQPDIHWMIDGKEVNNNRYNILDTVTLTNSSNNIVYYSKLEIIPLIKEDESTITCRASLYNPSAYIINSSVSQSSLLLAIDGPDVLDERFIQLQLLGLDTACLQWTSSPYVNNHLKYLTEIILVAIQERCGGCQYTKHYIIDQQFVCSADSPLLLTYRAKIYRSDVIEANTLVQYIQDWVTNTQATTTITLPQSNTQLTLNPECTVSITSFNDSLCTISAITSTLNGVKGTTPIGIGTTAQTPSPPETNTIQRKHESMFTTTATQQSNNRYYSTDKAIQPTTLVLTTSTPVSSINPHVTHIASDRPSIGNTAGNSSHSSIQIIPILAAACGILLLLLLATCIVGVIVCFMRKRKRTRQHKVNTPVCSAVNPLEISNQQQPTIYTTNMYSVYDQWQGRPYQTRDLPSIPANACYQNTLKTDQHHYNTSGNGKLEYNTTTFNTNGDNNSEGEGIYVDMAGGMEGESVNNNSNEEVVEYTDGYSKKDNKHLYEAIEKYH